MPWNFLLFGSDAADEHDLILTVEEPSNQREDIVITTRRSS